MITSLLLAAQLVAAQHTVSCPSGIGECFPAVTLPAATEEATDNVGNSRWTVAQMPEASGTLGKPFEQTGAPHWIMYPSQMCMMDASKDFRLCQSQALDDAHAICERHVSYRSMNCKQNSTSGNVCEMEDTNLEFVKPCGAIESEWHKGDDARKAAQGAQDKADQEFVNSVAKQLEPK